MFDLEQLKETLKKQPQIVRLAIAGVKGSAPREVGTSMLVWEDGYAGTIGGGRLELEAMKKAREMIANATLGQHVLPKVQRQPLGPSLQQCCGGSVVVLYEYFDQASLPEVHAGCAKGAYCRRVELGAAEMPQDLLRKVDHGSPSAPIEPLLLKGWFAEPLSQKTRQVFIYGAGNVGAALARLLAPLPELDVFLVDQRAALFVDLPPQVNPSFQLDPKDVMKRAQKDAAHFIMTPDHEYDLELCHTLLTQEFSYAGLIGSKTKWARFRKRLINLGHATTCVDQIACPIGDPSLGKHPHMIAISVAHELLSTFQGGVAKRRLVN